MPGGRRGLVAPQNTFLENIIRRSSSQRELPRFITVFIRYAVSTAMTAAFEAETKVNDFLSREIIDVKSRRKSDVAVTSKRSVCDRVSVNG